MFNLHLSFELFSPEYQSVIIVPPIGSAEFKGIKLTVSKAPLHKNTLIGIPIVPTELFSLLSSLLYTVVVYRSGILEKKYIIGYALFFVSIFAYVGVLQYGPSARANEEGLVFQVVSQKMIVLAFICSVLHQTFGFAKVKSLNNRVEN